MYFYSTEISLFHYFLTILQDGKKREIPGGKNDHFPFPFFSRYGKKQPFPFPFPIPAFPFMPSSRFFPFRSRFTVSRHPFPVPDFSTIPIIVLFKSSRNCQIFPKFF